MKTKVIVTFLLCTVTASQSAISAVRRTPVDDEPPHVVMERASGDDAHVLADLLAISPVIPRGPRDLLREYELEMASIAGRLSIDLEAISNAVGTGRVSRKQGEYVSGELYQIAVMQFQVFSALHAMLEQDLAQTQGCTNKFYPLARRRDGIGHNPIFLFAVKSIVGRIPEIGPNASQVHPEIDGPGTANHRTVDV